VTQTMIVKTDPYVTTPQSTCSARHHKVIGVFSYWRDLRARNNWNYWNGWNHWNRFLSDVFKAMEGLDPQVKRKILSDNARRFYGI
jgi:hypothetical protein